MKGERGNRNFDVDSRSRVRKVQSQQELFQASEAGKEETYALE